MVNWIGAYFLKRDSGPQTHLHPALSALTTDPNVKVNFYRKSIFFSLPVMLSIVLIGICAMIYNLTDANTQGNQSGYNWL